MESEYNPGLQVSEIIHGNIEVTMQVLEQMPADIADGAALAAQCLLNDNKILCCGSGQSAALSQVFSTNLLNRFQYERPALPAVNLSSDSTTITAITQDNSFQDVFANQVRALGQPGDVLLLVCDSNTNTALQAIQAAHDREMQILAITCGDCQDISALLLPEDLELCVPGNHRARIAEAQLLLINCLCELIDHQLFGGY